MVYLGRFKSYCLAVAACFLSLPALAFAEPHASVPAATSIPDAVAGNVSSGAILTTRCRTIRFPKIPAPNLHHPGRQTRRASRFRGPLKKIPARIAKYHCANYR